VVLIRQRWSPSCGHAWDAVRQREPPGAEAARTTDSGAQRDAGDGGGGAAGDGGDGMVKRLAR
jgi:hypothetical protein